MSEVVLEGEGGSKGVKEDVKGHIRSPILADNNNECRKQARITSRTHDWLAGWL